VLAAYLGGIDDDFDFDDAAADDTATTTASRAATQGSMA
jgi:hypothetical protein